MKGSGTHVSSEITKKPAPRNLSSKGTVPDPGKMPSSGETGGQKKK